MTDLKKLQEIRKMLESLSQYSGIKSAIECIDRTLFYLTKD